MPAMAARHIQRLIEIDRENAALELPRIVTRRVMADSRRITVDEDVKQDAARCPAKYGRLSVDGVAQSGCLWPILVKAVLYFSSARWPRLKRLSELPKPPYCDCQTDRYAAAEQYISFHRVSWDFRTLRFTMLREASFIFDTGISFAAALKVCKSVETLGVMLA